MKILIVDDHTLFATGLTRLLSDILANPDVTVACSADEAIEIVTEDGNFDLVLFDLTMPGMNGFEGLRLLRELMPEVPVVIVSASDNRTDIQNAFRHGAKGFVVKSSTSDVLSHALELVMSGETYIPSAALGTQGMTNLRWPSTSSFQTSGDPTREGLTPRQMEVLMLIARGQSNKEIARSLGMLEGTVKVHVKAVFQKLGVHNRTQAVVTGVQIGWLPRSEIF